MPLRIITGLKLPVLLIINHQFCLIDESTDYLKSINETNGSVLVIGHIEVVMSPGTRQHGNMIVSLSTPLPLWSMLVLTAIIANNFAHFSKKVYMVSLYGCESTQSFKLIQKVHLKNPRFV